MKSHIYYILNVIPIIVLTYLNLFFNLTMSFYIVKYTNTFIGILSRDLQKHLDKRQDIIFSQIELCKKEYFKNCNINIVPAMEQSCLQWVIFFTF